MYGNCNRSVSGRAFHVWVAVRCCLLWAALSPLISFAEVYWVRQWYNATYGVAIQIPYSSADDLRERWLDVWGVSSHPERASEVWMPNGWPDVASCDEKLRCPFAQAGAHWRYYNAQGAGTYGTMIHLPASESPTGRNLWAGAPFPGMTVTNYVSCFVWECVACRVGGTGNGGFRYDPRDKLVNSDNVPRWIFNHPDYTVTALAYSPDGTEITGYSGTVKPSFYPAGAVPSGSGQNGYVDFSGGSPVWQWFNGQNPGADNYGSTMQGIGDAVNAIGAAQAAQNATVNNANNTANNNLTTINNNLTTVNNNINTVNNNINTVNNYLADLAASGHGVLDGLDALEDAIDNALGTGGGGAAIPAASVEDIAATADEVAEVADNTADLKDDLESINGALDSVKAAMDGVKSSVDDVKTLLSGDGEPTESGGWEDVDTDEAELAREQVEQDILSQVSGLKSKGLSINDKIKTFALSLIGQWRNLGRTPPDFTISFSIPPYFTDYTFTPDVEGAMAFVSVLRSIEALALWLFFCWRVLKLMGTLWN